MCGIAGVVYYERDRRPDPAGLRAMGDAIAHRGPDGEGVYSAPGVGLVHRRLAIIDLAGGGQPIGSEDGTIQAVVNGEVYNFPPLRRELESKGHRFRTRSDSEVLVHLYEEQGEELVARLRGMFAFAIWDKARQRLVLGRDRIGLKPLYVYRDEEKLLFGSEIKAILAHPEVDRTIDAEAVKDYLTFGMIPGERSIFRKIRKLPPAHVLVIDRERFHAAPRRYWRLHVAPDLRLSPREWEEAIEAKIAETVAAHQIADVPVGAFLSGGLDSSVIVAIQSGLSAEPVQTFSIGFEEAGFSELPYARQIARQYGTQHSEEIITPQAAGVLDEVVHYYDEPFADSSAIPTLCVSRLASRHVKVVVSGDGGDEAFGGYRRYAHDLREAAWRQALPAWLRRRVLGSAARLWPKADWLPRPMRAKTMLTNLALDGADAYANTLAVCREPWRGRLLAPDLAAELQSYRPEDAIVKSFATASGGDPLSGMLQADMDVILPDDFLVKVDRASMAYGLEVRPPLVDHELLEMAAHIPSSLKVRDGETKWIFKRIYRDRLPQGFTTRPKHGFEIPVDQWLRGPLRETFESSVLAPHARVGEMIHQPAARQLYRQHLARIGRHGNTLWSLLVLAQWAEKYLGPESHRSSKRREPLLSTGCNCAK